MLSKLEKIDAHKIRRVNLNFTHPELATQKRGIVIDYLRRVRRLQLKIFQTL